MILELLGTADYIIFGFRRSATYTTHSYWLGQWFYLLYQRRHCTGDKSLSAVTGLGFKVDGQSLQLFAVTPCSVSLFSLHDQPPRRQTLDQIGSGVNSVAMSDRSVCSLSLFIVLNGFYKLS